MTLQVTSAHSDAQLGAGTVYLVFVCSQRLPFLVHRTVPNILVEGRETCLLRFHPWQLHKGLPYVKLFIKAGSRTSHWICFLIPILIYQTFVDTYNAGHQKHSSGLIYFYCLPLGASSSVVK